MKYLLTGGNGYIGTVVARSLLEAGHHVNFVVRDGSSSPHLTEVLEDFESSQYSLSAYTGDPESLFSAAEDVDRVIHLAAYFKTGHDAATASELVLSNIKYSVDLLAAVAEKSPEARVMCASSWSAYGPDGSYAPQNLYSATKKVVEDLAVTIPLRIGFLRFSDTYGPGDWRRKIVSIFRDAVDRGEDFTFGSPGTQKINLLHVEDIVRAIDHLFGLLERDSEPTVLAYDLFYPENVITLEEVAAKIVAKAGRGGYAFPSNDEPKPLPPQVRVMPGFRLSKLSSDYIQEVIGE